jgi:AhpD family alkylhydroperoxidase
MKKIKNKMGQRINAYEKGHSAMKALYGLGIYLAKSPIEQPLLNLIYFRVSQINGCAYCLDMHSKDLRATGETEQRLYVLDAWREAPFYTERERAALAWAEAVTKVTQGNVADEIYKEAQKQFSEEELTIGKAISNRRYAITSWQLNIPIVIGKTIKQLNNLAIDQFAIINVQVEPPIQF